MRANPLRAAFNAGRPVLNGWLSLPSALGAEILAAQGYDSLTVDLQHGMIDFSDALGMLQAIRAGGATPLVRAPWLEPGILMKLLDAGAYGVICPMIDSRADAERLVSYCRYPPEGGRSSGPTRAAFSAGLADPAAANRETLVFAMIETKAGFAARAEIAATPGIDGLYIGPSDLSLALSDGALPPGFDRREPEMLAAIDAIRDAAKAAGKLAALHCGAADYAAAALGRGFDMVTLMNDVRLLATAARESVERTRAMIAPR